MLLICVCACTPTPEFTIDGKGYYTRTSCVKSKSESRWEYHWGYNLFSGKWEWHFGPNTTTTCLEYRTDTIEIK